MGSALDRRDRGYTLHIGGILRTDEPIRTGEGIVTRLLEPTGQTEFRRECPGALPRARGQGAAGASRSPGGTIVKEGGSLG